MRVLRLVARIWATLSVAFVVFMFLTEWLGSHSPALPVGREWVPFALFPLGVSLGLLLAFARPRLGGAVAILSLLAFHLVEWWLHAPTGPWFAAVAAPGLLFLLLPDGPGRQRSGSGSGSPPASPSGPAAAGSASPPFAALRSLNQRIT